MSHCTLRLIPGRFILIVMGALGTIYIPGDSPVHRCDARAKIVALFVYTVALLAMPNWWSAVLLSAASIVFAAVARMPFNAMNRRLVPVYALALFSFLYHVVFAADMLDVLVGIGVAVRMVALVAMSFVVCFTTTATELLAAFRFLVSPLAKVGVPADDIAFTLALSVRFIPVIESELRSIRMAQKARGSEAVGSLVQKLRVWGMAFTALFVGLFRHADNLATAMDARCYGASDSRTELPRR